MNGLGLAPTTSTQSSIQVLRPLGSLGIQSHRQVHNVNNLITNVVQNDMAHVVYINLTDRKENSLYSGKRNRMRVSDWIEKKKFQIAKVVEDQFRIIDFDRTQIKQSVWYLKLTEFVRRKE